MTTLMTSAKLARAGLAVAVAWTAVAMSLSAPAQAATTSCGSGSIGDPSAYDMTDIASPLVRDGTSSRTYSSYNYMHFQVNTGTNAATGRRYGWAKLYNDAIGNTWMNSRLRTIWWAESTGQSDYYCGWNGASYRTVTDLSYGAYTNTVWKSTASYIGSAFQSSYCTTDECTGGFSYYPWEWSTYMLTF
ncbi:hypothetical protein [Microbispora sp. NBRC 16548]|uniref:hypothetical protein n=1 Tax=Microbispora sp. NBRC 16548 TaxID=3030994 RepID=UPI0016150792|nr:hypothetical protein [Microbispora sp. NBRC 16548]GLX04693.1 hypothetical protein Misp03_16200 [Microbispora sp. NBRC 16548]